MILSTNYRDSEGNESTLEGESVEALAQQLPEDFRGNLTVRDEPGFVRGWIHSREDWRAQ
jgi:hypothetical protein